MIYIIVQYISITGLRILFFAESHLVCGTYMCVCVEREREKNRERNRERNRDLDIFFHSYLMSSTKCYFVWT